MSAALLATAADRLSHVTPAGLALRLTLLVTSALAVFVF